MPKQYPECGDKIVGRIDKKFCSDVSQISTQFSFLELMNFNKAFIYCLLMSLTFSCSGPDTTYRFENIEDDDGITGGGTGNGTGGLVIDQQFQSYYDSFIAEMISRDVDLSDIPISIEFINPIDDVAYCGLGYSNYNNSGNARVEIVNSGDCWSNLPDIEQENLMFHEFGHALLARFHISGQSHFPNGLPRSIMCSNACSNFTIYGNYQDDQRRFYLDELLNENIDMPNWAGAKFFNETLDEDPISENANGWLSETISQSSGSTTNPYTYTVDDSNASSAPYALAITAAENSESNTYANWYKDYEISGFEACSNIIAIADFKLNGTLTNGYLNIYLDLFDDVNSEIEFNRYYAEAETIDLGNGFYRLRTTAICIPNETVKYRVRLVAKSESNATIYFDDIKVDLYD